MLECTCSFDFVRQLPSTQELVGRSISDFISSNLALWFTPCSHIVTSANSISLTCIIIPLSFCVGSTLVALPAIEYDFIFPSCICSNTRLEILVSSRSSVIKNRWSPVTPDLYIFPVFEIYAGSAQPTCTSE